MELLGIFLRGLLSPDPPALFLIRGYLGTSQGLPRTPWWSLVVPVVLVALVVLAMTASSGILQDSRIQ